MTVNYIDQEELLQEFRKSKERKEKYPNKGPDYWYTKRYIDMYSLMIERIAEKNRWRGYGSNYAMEFRSQAYFEFTRYGLNFPDNPPYNIFSYLTNMITFAFQRALKREHTQEKISEVLKDQYDVLNFEEEEDKDEDY